MRLCSASFWTVTSKIKLFQSMFPLSSVTGRPRPSSHLTFPDGVLIRQVCIQVLLFCAEVATDCCIASRSSSKIIFQIGDGSFPIWSGVNSQSSTHPSLMYSMDSVPSGPKIYRNIAPGTFFASSLKLLSLSISAAADWTSAEMSLIATVHTDGESRSGMPNPRRCFNCPDGVSIRHS